MVNNTRRHPSDRLLIRAIDGELSTPRAIALEMHLRQCEQCRARFAALSAVAEDITRAVRSELDEAPAREALRDRLHLQMTARATRWNQSWWFRFRRAVGPLPLVLRVGMLVAMLFLTIQSIWLAYATIAHTPTTSEAEALALPIRTLTPGAVGPVSIDALCAGRVVGKPPITLALRNVVLHEYRMEKVAAGEYELDYLITPELGGIADPRNLWPERYGTSVWNARVKDELEALLPQLICHGQLDVATAQRDIAENWIAAYKKYFKTDRPLGAPVALRNDDNDRPRASARDDEEPFAPPRSFAIRLQGSF